MKIAFVYSKDYGEFVLKVVECLKKRLNQEVECTEITSKATRKKYDLYVAVSNDFDDFKINLAKCKSRPLLITDNLDSNYIENVLSYVLDIVYLQSKPDIIVNRIIGNMEKCNG